VKMVKMVLLILCWIAFTLSLMLKSEKEIHFRQLAISEDEEKCKISTHSHFLAINCSLFCTRSLQTI
jgi:hypothetical protein